MKKKFLIIMIIFFLILLKVEAIRNSVQNGTIYVIVRNTNNEGIEGVKVFVDDEFLGETDEFGRFLMSGFEIGQYKVSVSKIGYKKMEKFIFIRWGVYKVSFTLIPLIDFNFIIYLAISLIFFLVLLIILLHKKRKKPKIHKEEIEKEREEIEYFLKELEKRYKSGEISEELYKSLRKKWRGK